MTEQEAERMCRLAGWLPVSHLRKAWDESAAVTALRETHPYIDGMADDAWGPDSGLKFWNIESNEYSHATTWLALWSENGAYLYTKIARIRFEGKWAEIWTDPDSENFAMSCKAYQLASLAESAKLQERIHNQGWVGLVVVWSRRGHNFEPCGLTVPGEEVQNIP